MNKACMHCSCPLICLVGEIRKVCVRCKRANWTKARKRKSAKKGPRSRTLERICQGCGVTFPTPDGQVRRKCDACKASKITSRQQRYYEAHKDDAKERAKQHYLVNHSLRRQQAKQYYETHREQVISRIRERRKSTKVESTKLGMMR